MWKLSILGVALLGMIVLAVWIKVSYHDLAQDFAAAVQAEFGQQPLLPERVLTEADIAHLPPPVRRYLIYTGAVGKSRVQNVRIVFAAEMIKNPKTAPLQARSVQYNFFGRPGRCFFMRAKMMGVPVQALHVYRAQQATFVVRVLALLNMVDLKGTELSKTETVTVLNDMCVMAPASLIDPRLTWKGMDATSAQVTFANGPYTVAAVLYFNSAGALVNFVSEDRAALQDDGTLRQAKWSTPMKDYIEIRGRRVPSYGEAVWNYPEGDFVYGKFTTQDVEFNVKALTP